VSFAPPARPSAGRYGVPPRLARETLDPPDIKQSRLRSKRRRAARIAAIPRPVRLGPKGRALFHHVKQPTPVPGRPSRGGWPVIPGKAARMSRLYYDLLL